MEHRTILHSDMNSFYASVEMMLDPSLRGKAVAVCGSTENRHGIVLAKSQLAKKAGVKTGMVNWEAKQRCPNLIMVPPQYDEYLKYSKLAHEIYYRYTDMVEPFGMDECWLDVSASRYQCGDGVKIAEEIRTACRTIKYSYLSQLAHRYRRYNRRVARILTGEDILPGKGRITPMDDLEQSRAAPIARRRRWRAMGKRICHNGKPGPKERERQC